MSLTKLMFSKRIGRTSSASQKEHVIGNPTPNIDDCHKEGIRHPLAPLHCSHEEYINSRFLALTCFLHSLVLPEFLKTIKLYVHVSTLPLLSTYFKRSKYRYMCGVTKIVLLIGLSEPLLRSLLKKGSIRNHGAFLRSLKLHPIERTVFDSCGSNV